MKQVRFDRGGSLRSPRVTDKGRMRVDGVFTRAGIFTYYNTDGTKRRELRPPEEVFRADSLASLELLPVVEDHPASGLLGTNAERAQGLTLEGVHREGADLVAGTLVVTDPGLIQTVRAGKAALSVGYEVEYDPTPGTHPTYGDYDGIQRNIRGDHLAIVDVGRAGPEARLRLDSATDPRVEIAPHAFSVPGSLTPGETSRTLNGAIMTPEEIQKLQEALAGANARAAKLEADLAAASSQAQAAAGRADGLEAEVAKLRATRSDAEIVVQKDGEIAGLKERLDAVQAQLKTASDPARFRAAVDERVRIETDAKAILGDKFRVDTDSLTLMLAVLEKTQGVNHSDKSADYVRARFDSAVESWKVGEAAVETLRTTQRETAVRADDARSTDPRTARQKMIAANRGQETK
jgi:hypothetical protein